MAILLTPSSGVSQHRAGREMAEAIIAQGYRKIGFMGTNMPLDHRARKRFEGFSEALAKAGIEIADQEFTPVAPPL